MLDERQQQFLNDMTEVDTGKAQPLFHPFPVINIYREDIPLEIANVKEKKEEEKLLSGLQGMLCDTASAIKSTIAINVEREGARLISSEEEAEGADFIFAMDKDAGFLKYAVTQGCSAIKATYGLISRYGMDTDAPSLAQPAIGAQNALMCAKVLEASAAVDRKDPMSRDAYIYEYVSALDSTDLTGMKIAIPSAIMGMELDETSLACYNQMLDVFEAKGAEIETVELDWMEHALLVHEMVSACERVMTADEIVMNCLEEDEHLQLGCDLLEEDNYEKYYLKALKLRSLIKDAYDLLFREYALFVVPFTGDADPYSLAANLSGLPAMAIPYVPYGAQLEDGSMLIAGIHMIAGANYENNLLKAANAYEQEVR